jgi:hypothetical protein
MYMARLWKASTPHGNDTGVLQRNYEIFWSSVATIYKITCRAFKTKELPREEAARGQRKAAAAAKGKSQKNPKPGRKQGVVWKLFNMCTYKLHALGDYLMAITHFGTSDNYTTQTVRFLHYIP